MPHIEEARDGARARAVVPSSSNDDAEQCEWLAQQFESLTSELEFLTPSQWAEGKRYLPPSITALPGPYRYAVAPYLREIVDCLAVDSPIREVSVMKGVQLCLTTGVLENVIGYGIDHVKSAAMMMVTADAELAKLRMEGYITPMLQISELEHLIKSSDETNARKTGKTDKKIEWVGGGFLIPYGAQNANKLRSIPIQFLLRDEIDGWPDVVGKDGDPLKLSADRTAAFEGTRKILDISTPLVKGMSKIEQRFLQGDQRYYFVCCVKCGFSQRLRWKRTNNDTGEISGIVWEMRDNRLVPGSVRYLCEQCGHAHVNDDKTRLLDPANGAEWIPTAEPASPGHRSYQISALYSPVGMQTWEACVYKWLDAWDVVRGQSKDNRKLQVFYNNVLGESFRQDGQSIKLENVSPHRRHQYRFGQIPNAALCVPHCGGPVLLLTATVDVHKESLKVAVYGWCRDRRAVLIDYHVFEGNTEHLDDAGSWGELRKLLEQREYTADDGKRYRIPIALIDSGYLTDHVYQFCSEYPAGVFPIKGQAVSPKSARVSEFSAFTTQKGIQGYGITVDLYKDRWSSALRRSWDGDGLQPFGHFNAPMDATDKQLKELTAERKSAIVDKANNHVGYTWHRTSGVDNELWDLLIYGNAAVDLLAWNLCCEQWEYDQVSWLDFWNYCENGTNGRAPYFTGVDPNAMHR